MEFLQADQYPLEAEVTLRDIPSFYPSPVQTAISIIETVAQLQGHSMD